MNLPKFKNFVSGKKLKFPRPWEECHFGAAASNQPAGLAAKMSSPFYDSSCDSDVGSDGTDPVVPRRSLSLSPSAKTRKRAIESSGLGGYPSPITRASVPSGFSSAMPVDFGISNAMSSGAKCTQDPHLRFSSCFESGNLKAAFYSEDQKAYNLVLEPDLNSRGHTLWFYFAVQNVQGGQTETFNIINLCKAHSLFENGMF